MKPTQMIMEGILPLEQQFASRLLKAWNHGQMMRRLAAAKPAIPPQVVDNAPASAEEIAEAFRRFKNANLSGFQAVSTNAHMNSQFPTVEEMLKGISKVPTAAKGEPDSLTAKEATMEKAAMRGQFAIALLKNVAGKSVAGELGVAAGTPQWTRIQNALHTALHPRTATTMMERGIQPPDPLAALGLSWPASDANLFKNLLTQTKGLGGQYANEVGRGVKGLRSVLANPAGGAGLKAASEHRRSEAEIKARRRRIAAILLPTLGLGGYGALVGGMGGAKNNHGLEGALAGGLLGAGVGAGVGGIRLGLAKYLGTDPLTGVQDHMKTAYVKEPQGVTDQLSNFSELKKLVAMATTNPDKIKPAEDVLQNQSITVPHGVVRGAAGAAGGALIGNLLARLATGPIDPRGSEETASQIRRKRNLGAGVGGALGLFLASRKDILDSNALDSLRQRFAV